MPSATELEGATTIGSNTVATAPAASPKRNPATVSSFLLPVGFTSRSLPLSMSGKGLGPVGAPTT